MRHHRVFGTLATLAIAAAALGCGEDLLDDSAFKYEVLPEDIGADVGKVGDAEAVDTAGQDAPVVDAGAADAPFGQDAADAGDVADDTADAEDTAQDVGPGCKLDEPCDDGDKCSLGDKCNAVGACIGGAAKKCDDGKVCTDDSCDKVTGDCKATNNAASCDDGDQCTKNTTCADGACKGGEPSGKCECLQDADCAKKEDGDLCNGVLQCDPATDSCVIKAGSIVTCSKDGETDCKKSACDPKTGKCALQPVADGGDCDDASICSTKDACKGGACLPAAVTTCDDLNPCTGDSCDAKAGCQHAALSAAASCTDNNACTEDDACEGGACKAGKLKSCDDKNPCTTDSCDAKTGACAQAHNTAACDDGDKCTDKDTCGGGACKGATTNCDDGNACTKDSCAKAAGCAHEKLTGGSCADGDACVASSACKDGACTVETVLFARKYGVSGVMDDAHDAALLADGRIVTYGARDQLHWFSKGGSWLGTKAPAAATDWAQAITAVGNQPAVVSIVSANGLPSSASVRVRLWDAAGKAVLWGKTVSNGPDNWPHFRGATTLAGDDIGFVGWTGQDKKSEQVWLVRLAKDGTVKHNSAYKLATRSWAYSVAQHADKVWIAGAAEPKAGDGYKGAVAVVDAGGKLLWSRVLQTKGDRHLLAVQPTGDGGFSAVGRGDDKHASFPSGLPFFALRVDAVGKVVTSEQLFGGQQFMLLDNSSAIVLPNGDVAVAADGQKGVNPFGFAARIRSDGRTLWQRQSPIGGSEGRLRAVAAAPSDGLLFAGSVPDKAGSLDRDVTLLRTDAFGQTDCGKGGCQTKAFKECDDGVQCTDDGCAAKSGCTHKPVADGAACGGQGCNVGSTCAKGKCTGGKPRLWAWQGGKAGVLDQVEAVAQGNDHVWAVGSDYKGPVGGVDLVLWRLSAAGAVTHTRHYGSATGDFGKAALAVADGGVVATALWSANTPSGDGGDGVIVRTKADGTQLFATKVDAQGTQEVLGPGALTTLGDGWAACGVAVISGKQRPWIVAVTESGAVAMNVARDDMGASACNTIAATQQGVAVGLQTAGTSPQTGVAALDPNGALLWSRRYPMAGKHRPLALRQDAGGLVAALLSDDAAGTEQLVTFLRIDASGQSLGAVPARGPVQPTSGTGSFGDDGALLFVGLLRLAGGQTGRGALRYAPSGAFAGKVHEQTKPGVLTSGAVTADGALIAGWVESSGQRDPVVTRADHWGNTSCGGKCDGVQAEGCDDKNPCTLRACDPAKGCVAAGDTDVASCDDGDSCTGDGSCAKGACKAGKPEFSDFSWDVAQKDDVLAAVTPLAKGHVLVAGATRKSAGPDTAGYAARLDATGAVLWSSQLGSKGINRFTDIAVLPDGRALAVGQRSVAGKPEGWLATVGPLGGADVGLPSAGANDVLEAIAVGHVGTFVGGVRGADGLVGVVGPDLLLASEVKVPKAIIRSLAINKAGDVAFAGSIDGSKLLLGVASGGAQLRWMRAVLPMSKTSAQANALVAAGDGWTVAGATRLPSAAQDSGLLAHFDAGGALRWAWTTGTGKAFVELSGLALDGSSYVFSGRDEESIAGKEVGFVGRFANGQRVWGKHHGAVTAGSYEAMLNDLAVLSDGSVAAVGAHNKVSHMDNWLVRSDRWGNATCTGNKCGDKKPTDCDDNNPCTADTCWAGAGCAHVKITGGACDDGKHCTVNNTCKAGSCGGGTPRLFGQTVSRINKAPPAGVFPIDGGFLVPTTLDEGTKQSVAIFRHGVDAGPAQQYVPSSTNDLLADALMLGDGSLVLAEMQGAIDAEGDKATARVSRVTADGAVLWKKTQAFAYNLHRPRGVDQLADGDLVVTGHTGSSSLQRPFMLRIGRDGEDFNATLLDTNAVNASCWRATDRPGGLWLACHTHPTNGHLLMLAVREDGKAQFGRAHAAESSGRIEPKALAPTADGGAMVALAAGANALTGPFRLVVARTDESGQVRWQRTWGSTLKAISQVARAANGDWLATIQEATGRAALGRFSADLGARFVLQPPADMDTLRFYEQANGDVVVLSAKGLTGPTNAHRLEVIDRWGNRVCGAHDCPGKQVTACDGATPCQLRTCDPASGCKNSSLTADGPCDDGKLCTGAGHCNNGSCEAGDLRLYEAAVDYNSNQPDRARAVVMDAAERAIVVGTTKAGNKTRPIAIALQPGGKEIWKADYEQAQTSEVYGAAIGDGALYAFGFVGNSQPQPFVLKAELQSGNTTWVSTTSTGTATTLRSGGVLGDRSVVGVGDKGGGAQGYRAHFEPSTGKLIKAHEETGVTYRAFAAEPGTAGYVAAGGELGKSAFWLLRADQAGDALWQREYTINTTQKYARSVVRIGGDGWALAGSETEDGKLAPVVLRVARSGTLRWKKTLAGGTDRRAHAIAAGIGGRLLLGLTETTAPGKTRGVVHRLDAFGNVLSAALRPGSGDSVALESLVSDGVGGWMAVGWQTKGGAEDLWASKADRMDHSGCPTGKCASVLAGCDDGDPCTIDSCDAAKGCQHQAVAVDACDDGIACTDDSCVAKSGCAHVHNGKPCPSCRVLHDVQPGLIGGVHVIAPGGTPVAAYCDMTTDGGGWTMLQAWDISAKDAYKTKSFALDFPRSSKAPNFDDYRLPKASIDALLLGGAQVHARCHRLAAVSKDDWLLADVLLLTEAAYARSLSTDSDNPGGVQCVVRGHSCDDNSLEWYNGSVPGKGHYHPHSESSKWPQYPAGGEDIFGYHNAVNTKHLCHQSAGEVVWMVR